MATLTQHSGNINMGAPFDVDHASQITGAPSFYTWQTSAGLTVQTYSILDDITFNATSPTGGTVHALDAYSGSTLLYDVAAMSASLVAIATAPNLETYWRAALAGDTTIFVNGGFTGNGDFVTVAGTESLTGGADTFDVIGIGSLVLSGDASTVDDGGTLTGGGDIIDLHYGVGAIVWGDAATVVGGLAGGADHITVDSTDFNNSSIFGDGGVVSTSGSPLAVAGGDDTVVVALGGDGIVVAGDFGTTQNRAVTGGDDTLDGRNAGFSFSAFGDVENLGGGSNLTAGNDTIMGSLLYGSFLYGDGETISTIFAVCGDDTITGGAGDDTIYGDIHAIEGSTAAHTGGNDLIKGGRGNDTIQGQVGNDTIDGGLGDDSLNGGNGSTEVNLVAFDGVNAAVFVDLAAGIARGQGADQIAFFRNVVGSNLADTIAGDSAANALTGLNGNDLLRGRDGNDTMIGGSGNDTLDGGAGIDRLEGGAGADAMNGGADSDVYVNPVLAEGDTIVEAAAGGTDKVESSASFSLGTLLQVENLALTGSANIDGTGNDGANLIAGNSGVNILNGGQGNDTLSGGPGKDVLIGGKNADVMNGGTGADTFRFATTSTAADTINGFSTAEDRFDLTGGTFSARTETAGNTLLIHAGGNITITGVTGLTLAQWNLLVLPSGGVARESALAQTHHESAWSFSPDLADLTAQVPPNLAFLAHTDFAWL